MIFQTIEFLQTLANIFGAILLALKPIVMPIGSWMVDWISTTIDFLKENFSTDLTIYIAICVILVISAVIVNIVWPGDRPGTIFSKGVEKVEEIGEKIEEKEEDIVEDVRRCKDCGNPIGDQDICPLCGARN